MLLLRMLVLYGPELSIHSREFAAQFQEARARAPPPPASGVRPGGGVNNGDHSRPDAPKLVEPALGTLGALRLRAIEFLLVQPGRAQLGVVGLQALTTVLSLLFYLATNGWKAAAVSLLCNYVILYTCLRIRAAT